MDEPVNDTDSEGDQDSLMLYLKERVPFDDPVWLLTQAVDLVGFSHFSKQYAAGDTEQSKLSPATIFKVILYSFVQKVHSIRRMEDHCIHDLRWRCIVGYQPPDQTAIRAFIQENENYMQDAFLQTLAVLKGVGMRYMGEFKLGGLKVKANKELASNNAKFKLQRQFQAMLDEAMAESCQEGLWGVKGNKVDPDTRKRLAVVLKKWSTSLDGETTEKNESEEEENRDEGEQQEEGRQARQAPARPDDV